ncbi:MAG: hypothetical protein AB2A00_05195 [Myxococcota bacterium]
MSPFQHLMTGSLLLLAQATVLLGGAVYVYARRFDGLRRGARQVEETVRAATIPPPARSVA